MKESLSSSLHRGKARDKHVSCKRKEDRNDRFEGGDREKGEIELASSRRAWTRRLEASPWTPRRAPFHRGEATRPTSNLYVNGVSRGGSDDMKALHDKGELLESLTTWGGKALKVTKHSVPSNS